MLHGGRGSGGVPLPVVRHITQQLLTALDFLHRECGIVHTGACIWGWMAGRCAGLVAAAGAWLLVGVQTRGQNVPRRVGRT